MTEIKLIVGGRLEDDAAAFGDAWHRTKNGEEIREQTLVFENREKFA